MSRRIQLTLPGAFLALAILACNAFPSAVSPSANAVGTAAMQTVAAQLSTVPQPTAVASTAPSSASTPVPSAPASTPVPSATSICDRASFVSETVPDGSAFAPGTSFTKTWRLQNTGNCSWTTSYAVVYDSGDALGASPAVALSGTVAPGQTVDLAVNMQAPGTPGSYTGYWRLRNASGVLFGLTPGNASFWVKIKVVAPSPAATLPGHVIVPPLHLIPLLPFSSTQQVYVSGVNIPAGNVGSGTAACPSGSVVVGGGFALSANMYAYTQLPSGNGWQVYAKNQAAVAQGMTVYAICLSNTSGATSLQVASGTAPVGSYAYVQASCPGGSVVTAGGFATSGNDTLWVYNSSAQGNGWQLYARNLSASPQGVNVYAICLAGTSGTTSVVGNNSSIGAGATGSAEAACPSGKLVTGGGYALSDNLSVYNSSMDVSDSTKWNVYASNSGSGPALMNVYAICLSP